MIQWMLAIWCLVPLSFLNSAWTSGSSWFTCCWSLDWRILSIYFASMWDECKCEVVWTFPDSSVGKESTCNAGDPSLIPGLGRRPGEGNGYLLQDSGLENLMDYTVHGVTKSWTCLSNFHFHLNILWYCFSLGLEWKTDLFQSCGHCWVFKFAGHFLALLWLITEVQLCHLQVEVWTGALAKITQDLSGKALLCPIPRI